MRIVFKEVHRGAFTALCRRKEELERGGSKLLEKTLIGYQGTEICGSLEIEFSSAIYGGQRKADIDEAMKIITEYLW